MAGVLADILPRWIMATVYLETTIPSYLAADPSRDLIVAAHQQITHEWWRDAPERFELAISEAVLDEIQMGDRALVARRLTFVDEATILPFNQTVQSLIETYSKKLGLTGKARLDVPHFAFAVAYEIDYLVTWNCAHIANGIVIQRLRCINEAMGLWMPLIVTPEELLSH
jgi:hypothetical protein